nr:hypothetical protein BaRGS_033486 [Batillaria attramentaria]
MNDSGFQSDGLHQFHKWYAGVHGYLSLLVCFFGIPMNIINITVLTRRHMRTPINCILTWLAVFDMFTMASYVPFAMHFYCIFSPWELSPEKNRYKHIYSPAKGHLTRMRRLVRARLSVLVVTILSVVGLVPNYLTNQIFPFKLRDNRTVWVMDDLKLATNDTKPIVLLNLWIYSILAKLLPCVLMVVYGGLLLTTLRANLRQRLRRTSTVSVSSGRTGTDNSRTTRMLLVVIVLFVVTELPQAILIFLSVTLANFFFHVYVPLGDLMDMLALINNGVNFVLYCSMSRDFRNTLLAIWRPTRSPMPRKAYRSQSSPFTKSSNNCLSVNGTSQEDHLYVPYPH